MGFIGEDSDLTCTNIICFYIWRLETCFRAFMCDCTEQPLEYNKNGRLKSSQIPLKFCDEQLMCSFFLLFISWNGTIVGGGSSGCWELGGEAEGSGSTGSYQNTFRTHKCSNRAPSSRGGPCIHPLCALPVTPKGIKLLRRRDEERQRCGTPTCTQIVTSSNT